MHVNGRLPIAKEAAQQAIMNHSSNSPDAGAVALAGIPGLAGRSAWHRGGPGQGVGSPTSIEYLYLRDSSISWNRLRCRQWSKTRCSVAAKMLAT